MNEKDYYDEALKAVLEIRKDRRSAYKDTFYEDDFLFLIYQVENKMKRCKLQIVFNNNKETIQNEDVVLDSLIDGVNYGLFAIAKILKNKDNEK